MLPALTLFAAPRYGDNLECGKHIQAPAGQTVSLLFTQFNLEDSADFVRVYDGRDANAPVLGEFTGDNTPPLVSSTGRDMFIQFTTDHGNYGITQAGSHEDPGFCESFAPTAFPRAPASCTVQPDERARSLLVQTPTGTLPHIWTTWASALPIGAMRMGASLRRTALSTTTRAGRLGSAQLVPARPV